ncbi:hypothetical protein JOC70_000697 [Clostridium pascui]|uniref:hypothetical protein n=1 Tax=Clostridium pascui TaxID=46609 RepID=UPI00195C63D4|nr:hypothetical protein [Clostridium pascui]MBM7869228.1 hypothetical protein [Clostridium pascui]
MNLKEAYIWLDVIKERMEADTCEDYIIDCLELCKLMIKEKVTGYADERVK